MAFPTWPSPRDLIKECLRQVPKETVERVYSEVGGMVEAAGPGQLPRSEKQVMNIRRRNRNMGTLVMLQMIYL